MDTSLLPHSFSSDAKVIVVDECVTCVGSINFGARSFSLNAECAAVTHDPKIAEQAMRAFEDDLPNAKRVTTADLEELSVKDRVLDSLVLFHSGAAVISASTGK